ncbi:MAG: CO dehydrogenase/acetyl-CoA synthase complex subunit epsilon [Chloroflexota bacterium]|nr:MAG: CO dehydrogenase/acetyl-CoA synthase complex subunit epsilon [Chloroflexota bacterium]
MSAVIPRHRVNVLTGIKSAKLIEDPVEYANLIKKAKRPLLVVGPLLLGPTDDGKVLMEYAVDIAKARNIPICATAHSRGKLVELGVEPDSIYDAVEIVNALKDPDWQGVKKEGNHDLVMFFGIRSDLGTQGLSTLKHFAPHLKTMTLCKHYFPHANYSLPNYKKDTQWVEFLEGLITNLKKGD